MPATNIHHRGVRLAALALLAALAACAQAPIRSSGPAPRTETRLPTQARGSMEPADPVAPLGLPNPPARATLASEAAAAIAPAGAPGDARQKAAQFRMTIRTGEAEGCAFYKGAFNTEGFLARHQATPQAACRIVDLSTFTCDLTDHRIEGLPEPATFAGDFMHAGSAQAFEGYGLGDLKFRALCEGSAGCQVQVWNMDTKHGFACDATSDAQRAFAARGVRPTRAVAKASAAAPRTTQMTVTTDAGTSCAYYKDSFNERGFVSYHDARPEARCDLVNGNAFTCEVFGLGLRDLPEPVRFDGEVLRAGGRRTLEGAGPNGMNLRVSCAGPEDCDSLQVWNVGTRHGFGCDVSVAPRLTPDRGTAQALAKQAKVKPARTSATAPARPSRTGATAPATRPPRTAATTAHAGFGRPPPSDQAIPARTAASRFWP